MFQPRRYPGGREEKKIFFFLSLQASDLLRDSDAYQQRVKIAIRILPGRRGGVTSRGLGGGGVQLSPIRRCPAPGAASSRSSRGALPRRQPGWALGSGAAAAAVPNDSPHQGRRAASLACSCTRSAWMLHGVNERRKRESTEAEKHSESESGGDRCASAGFPPLGWRWIPQPSGLSLCCSPVFGAWD